MYIADMASLSKILVFIFMENLWKVYECISCTASYLQVMDPRWKKQENISCHWELYDTDLTITGFPHGGNLTITGFPHGGNLTITGFPRGIESIEFQKWFSRPWKSIEFCQNVY